MFASTYQKNQTLILNPFILPVIILIEGYVSIATEILAIRQLLPVAGGSVIVTSLVIGIFLLFLALGYQKGGHVQSDPIHLLSRNFFIGSIWLGVGLSYFFVSLFFLYTQKLFGQHVLYPLISYLLLVIAPLIYLLGQTLPVIMNMVKQNQAAGKVGGYALSLSTVGSFLGSILTSLLTLHYFGVAYTVFINAVLLLGLSLYLSHLRNKWVTHFILSLFTLAVVYFLNIAMEKSLFVLTDSYANYQITAVKDDNLKSKNFIINEALSSHNNALRQGFPYIENIKNILFYNLKLRGRPILVLGAGGFSLSAGNTFNNEFTYVDIDGQIDKAAVPNFIDKINGRFIADDARHFLNSGENQYAAIVVDVYSDYKAIPAHLVTMEYMHAIKKRLEPGGTVIINIVANPMFTDPYSKRLDNTIRSVFHNCMATPQNYANEITNILYLCTQAGLEDNTIYSDNLNRSTTDSFNW